ncbi:hypothetical protein [Flammeovirga sp. SJP92]|uniref:hypothetical protein n=1 Tax=Flammeovirga sp. SJP92 TaxID=1775430 RepID=UPI000789777D|nr:hypothetical protein [Flammeovirga sp. SJP92]KXX70151.1 hypothetical protein AVL50_14870 [Flammeovirga sp. SJP92]
MGNTKIWIVILFIFISLGIVGIQSGWFVDIKVQEKKNEGWVLSGLEYNGKLDSKSFTQLYDSISNDVKAGKLKGELAALFFDNPNTDKKVKVIVGVIGKSRQSDGYTYFDQKPYKEIYSEIALGELLTPNPQNVIEVLSEKATTDYPSSQRLYLEYYPSQTSVVQSIILQ